MGRGKVDFRLVIVKGLVEYKDGTAYFGSLLGFRDHEAQAAAAGWVQRDERDTLCLTAAGSAVYREAGLEALPRHGRAYTWDWSAIPTFP